MRAWSRIVAMVAALALGGLAAGCGSNGSNNDTGAPTATPTPEPTASPTSTPPPQIPCPQQVTYIVEGEESDFDSGTTGIYFDQKAGDGGTLTFGVDCPGDFLGACGQCPISGPIASTTVVDNRRCQDASEVICETDADCPGSSCVFFFGAPLPVSGGGFPICVVNEVVGEVTGFLVPELGRGSSDFDLLLRIHTGVDVAQPCPVCDGPEFNTAGTCVGGARDGEPCTVHGTTEVFGNTSFDCPPNPGAAIGETLAPLDLTTETQSLEATETCLTGQDCYCPGQAEPNSCVDLVCTIGDDEEGTCEAGPFDLICEIETFRGCLTDADCPREGDVCVGRTRKCPGPTDATGNATGPLTRTGVPGTERPVQVSTICLNATSSPAVNTTAGLPGPAAIRLPTDICIFSSCP